MTQIYSHLPLPCFQCLSILTSTTPDLPHHLIKTQGTASELLWGLLETASSETSMCPSPAPGRKSKLPSRCLTLRLPAPFSPSPAQSCPNMLSPLQCSQRPLGLSSWCSHSGGASSTITVLLWSRFSPRAQHKPGPPTWGRGSSLF